MPAFNNDNDFPAQLQTFIADLDSVSGAENSQLLDALLDVFVGRN
jgi:hypothetical protein